MTAVVVFTGGGSLDGAALSIPAAASAVRTTGGSNYVVDDLGRAWFVGFGDTGQEMTAVFSSASDRRELEAAEDALKPRGCARCGMTFGSAAAYAVHFENGPDSRCLPPGAFGQLTERDGIWVLPGSDAATR